MNLLVDTCTALWYWSGESRLSAEAEEAIRDPANEVWFHQGSYLEFTLKYSLGQLSLTEAPSTLVPRALEADRFHFTPLSTPDIAGLEKLS
ncbi:MAG: PIN domain nuclease [Verrucomicrobiales bacterium]